VKTLIYIAIIIVSLSLSFSDTGWGPAFIGSPHLPEQIGEWGQFNFIEHPTIRMVSEDVRIALHKLGASVFAEFVFENTGEETDVEMVYPLQSDWKSTTVYNLKVFEEGGEDYIESVKFEYVIHDDESDDELSLVDWATWKVHFDGGETKRIQVIYNAPYGFNGELKNLHDKWGRVVSGTEVENRSPLHRICDYVLYTGASWKGTIGEGRISFYMTAEVCWEDLIGPDGVGLLQESFAFPQGGKYDSTPQEYFEGIDIVIEENALTFKFEDYEPRLIFGEDGSVHTGDSTIFSVVLGVEDERFEFLADSSHLPADDYGSYSGENICDASLYEDSLNPNSLKTVWAEGVEGDGVGEWVKLAPEYNEYDRYFCIQGLKGILVYNGFYSDVDLFWKNGRAFLLDVTLLKDGKEINEDQITFLEPRGWPIIEYMCPSKEYCIFDKSYDTDEVLLTIEKVYSGKDYDDTCIAEVLPIYADPRTHHDASSTLVEDYSDIFRYHPIKIDDGDSSTCWVEGVEGYGVGEFVEFEWDNPRDLVALKILPGFAGSETLWSENARPKKITVQCFSGEESILKVSFTLEDIMKEQTFYLTNEVVYGCSRLRITIDEVYPGEKYDDTCISEVGFVEF